MKSLVKQTRGTRIERENFHLVPLPLFPPPSPTSHTIVNKNEQLFMVYKAEKR